MSVLTIWPDRIFDPDPVADWSQIDRRYRLPNAVQIRDLAAKIDRAHAAQRDSTRAWRTGEHRTIGLFGERAFCRVFRLPMDTTIRQWGNRRANATLADGTIVDVVTRRVLKDGSLPDLTRRKRGTPVSAQVAVLIVWIGEAWEPVFLGWAEDRAIVREGAVHQYKDGTPNYVLPVNCLLPMWELMARHRPGDVLASPDSLVISEPRPVPDAEVPSIQQPGFL